LKKDKKSFLFLVECCLGAILGIVLFSKSVLNLLTAFPMPMKYFFIGAVAGGVPLIYKSAKLEKFSYKAILFPLLGFVLVILISLIPNGVFTTSSGVSGIIIQILGGVIVAAALVLPGISVSQMLLMLGLYETVMTGISTFNILPLIPLAIGVLLGTAATAKLMNNALKSFPKITYLVILGFVLGSLKELFPGVPQGREILTCLLTAAAGFFAIYTISSGSLKSGDKSQ